MDILKEAAINIKNADVLFITAGAGMGVDSGLPDFRGNEGFWKAYPLLKEENLSFLDLANPDWFREDPQRAWGFYGHRYNLYKETTPHAGFHILQEWSALTKEDPFVFTSNVDGHFQRSGFDSHSVIECHGSINHLQCQHECRQEIWKAENLNLTINKARLIATSDLPKCPYCDAISRPNILMFGDAQWIHTRSSKQNDNFEQWKDKYQDANIVTIEMGAGKAIPTVRMASDSISGKTIRINPRDSDGNSNTLSVPLGSLDALSKINDYMT